MEALLDLLEAPRLAALASAAGPSTVDVLQILLNLCAQGFARYSADKEYGRKKSWGRNVLGNHVTRVLILRKIFNLLENS